MLDSDFLIFKKPIDRMNFCVVRIFLNRLSSTIDISFCSQCGIQDGHQHDTYFSMRPVVKNANQTLQKNTVDLIVISLKINSHYDIVENIGIKQSITHSVYMYFTKFKIPVFQNSFIS